MVRPGDRVYYAGNVNRPGSDAQFNLVDERVVGRAPKSLGFAESAALPLTTLTAWELMFDRIGVKRGEGADRRSMLVVGGAGGVGSIAIQLARKLTSLTIVATASRPDTRAWAGKIGYAPHHRSHQAVRTPAQSLGAPEHRHRALAHGHGEERRPDHRGRSPRRAVSG